MTVHLAVSSFRAFPAADCLITVAHLILGTYLIGFGNPLVFLLPAAFCDSFINVNCVKKFFSSVCSIICDTDYSDIPIASVISPFFVNGCKAGHSVLYLFVCPF